MGVRNTDYVVLPRDALFEFFGRMALPPWQENGEWIGGNIDCAPIAQEIQQWVEDNDLSSVYPLYSKGRDESS
jgi:hypothetical protein